MDLPVEVRVYNELMGLKGTRGSLIAVSVHGFFELKLRFKDDTHRVLLPVAQTGLIFSDAEFSCNIEAEFER
jgi:hypothetical protein